MPNVLVISNDVIGEEVAGAGIRALEIARRMARHFAVTLLAPRVPQVQETGIELGSWLNSGLARHVRRADVVFSQGIGWSIRLLATSRALQIIDLYDPLYFEELALRHGRAGDERWTAPHGIRLQQQLLLRRGDFFICASERQRDFWLGGLVAAGRIDAADYSADPSGRGLIDVAPFGLPETPPPSGPGAIKGAWPGIGAGDQVVLWGGGVWDWLDPLTAIRAVLRIAEKNPRVRLLFMGMAHPHPGVPVMEMARAARALARELDPGGAHVFFNESWVPYSRRWAFLRDADVAVSLHRASLETRMAFRTRLLDCMWCGVPAVLTEGDTLGDLAGRRGAARVVAPGDVDGAARAIADFLDDAGRRESAARAMRDMGADYTWERCAQVLIDWIQRNAGRPSRRFSPVSPVLGAYYARKAAFFFREGGVRGLAGKVAGHFRTPAEFRGER